MGDIFIVFIAFVALIIFLVTVFLLYKLCFFFYKRSKKEIWLHIFLISCAMAITLLFSFASQLFLYQKIEKNFVLLRISWYSVCVKAID